jgi:3-hydroxybutyryl-CoA dehydrogenase
MTASEREKIESNLGTCCDISRLKAELIIEAIVEQMETKKSFFQAVEKVKSSETVLATNTSSLSATAMAESLKYPERFLGLHFFNPAHQMKLVEVVSTRYTDLGLEEEMYSLCLKAGKIPVRVKDSPGFIVNRVARHYYLESLRLLEESQSGVQGIDRLLKSAGFRMGPFELMDMIGIDINFAVTTSLHEAFLPNPKFAPSRVQQEMIEAGQLGRKTGKGFYDYAKN